MHAALLLCLPATATLSVLRLPALDSLHSPPQGFHIAEALDLPCVAAAPCQVPYSCPGGFKRRFVSEYGVRLHRMLSEAGENLRHFSTPSANAEKGSPPEGGVLEDGTNNDMDEKPLGPELGSCDSTLSWKEIFLWCDACLDAAHLCQACCVRHRS